MECKAVAERGGVSWVVDILVRVKWGKEGDWRFVWRGAGGGGDGRGGGEGGGGLEGERNGGGEEVVAGWVVGTEDG